MTCYIVHTLRFLLYVLVLLYVLCEIFCFIFTYKMACFYFLMHEKSKIWKKIINFQIYVPYDLKNQAYNIYKYRTYNRNLRVLIGIFVLLCVSAATSLADTNSHARRISQRSFSNPCHLTLLSSKVILYKSCGELRRFLLRTVSTWMVPGLAQIFSVGNRTDSQL